MDGILQRDIVDLTSFDVHKNSTGQVDINGTQELTTIDYGDDLDFEYGDRVDFLTAPDGIVGTFENFPVNGEFYDGGGNRVFFGNDGTSLYIQAVSEPASIVVWALLGLALVGYAGRRKVMG